MQAISATAEVSTKQYCNLVRGRDICLFCTVTTDSETSRELTGNRLRIALYLHIVLNVVYYKEGGLSPVSVNELVPDFRYIWVRRNLAKSHAKKA